MALMQTTDLHMTILLSWWQLINFIHTQLFVYIEIRANSVRETSLNSLCIVLGHNWTRYANFYVSPMPNVYEALALWNL